jgi:hypothetical protein
MSFLDNLDSIFKDIPLDNVDQSDTLIDMATSDTNIKIKTEPTDEEEDVIITAYYSKEYNVDCPHCTH